MTFIKWLLILIATIVIAIVAFLFYMRSHDGPIEIFAGGPFTSGQLVEGSEPNWNDYKDLVTFEVQTMSPPRSRTTWLVVVENRLFIPSSYMNTAFGKIWKHWPHHAEKDGRALLRIDDKIYEQDLSRISAEDPIIPGVLTALSEKYPVDGSIEQVKANDTWIFELKPRQ